MRLQRYSDWRKHANSLRVWKVKAQSDTAHNMGETLRITWKIPWVILLALDIQGLAKVEVVIQ